MSMTFFLSIVFFAILLVSGWNRLSRLERRIERLEQGVPVSTSVEGRALVSQDVLRKEGIHEGDMFARAVVTADAPLPRVAPAPAPAPMPFVSAEGVTGSTPKHEGTNEETGARWLGRIGAFAVFLGFAYFLKYAFDNNLIGESGRVIIGIVFGLGFIGVGQKLRAKYLNYSDMLMAGGIGILYLSLYASYGFYHLLPVSLVFVLMSLVTFFGMVLALVGNTRGLAVFSLLGGFLTPVLLSTGENHLFVLSAYLLMLDLGAFGVAWFKKWMILNFVSFGGTLLLFGGWLGSFYEESQLAETLSIVSVFFIIFLTTSVLHHLLRKEPTTKGDLALLVLNAMWYFGIASSLLDPSYHEFLGFFALLLSIIYLSVAYAAYESNHTDRTLNLFLPGIAVVFLSIAIPLQLSGLWVAFAWLVEAVVLIATGLYLREKVITLFGWIVLFLGFFAVANEVALIDATTRHAFLNTGFFLMASSVSALYFIAWLYETLGRGAQEEGKNIKLFALVLASFGTAIAFTTELAANYHHYQSLSWLIEGGVVLTLGLYARSRVVEVLGWVFTGIGMLIMMGDVNQIHMGISSGYQVAAYDPTPFFNLGVFLMSIAILTTAAFAVLYRQFGSHLADRKKLIGVIVVCANILTIACVTSEISYVYDRDIRTMEKVSMQEAQANANYYGNMNGTLGYGIDTNFTARMEKERALASSKENAVSVFWVFYAVLLVVIGFVKRVRTIRLFGLVFFFITAARVFIQILGSADELGRIFSTIVFGLIALGASFLYVKFKDRIIHE